jgi:hypothetical protein
MKIKKNKRNWNFSGRTSNLRNFEAKKEAEQPKKIRSYKVSPKPRVNKKKVMERKTAPPQNSRITPSLKDKPESIALKYAKKMQKWIEVINESTPRDFQDVSEFSDLEMAARINIPRIYTKQRNSNLSKTHKILKINSVLVTHDMNSGGGGKLSKLNQIRGNPQAFGLPKLIKSTGISV